MENEPASPSGTLPLDPTSEEVSVVMPVMVQGFLGEQIASSKIRGTRSAITPHAFHKPHAEMQRTCF